MLGQELGQEPIPETSKTTVRSVVSSIQDKLLDLDKYLFWHKNMVYPDGTTVLMKAIKNGHYQVIRSLLKARVNIESIDNYGQTAEILARKNGDPKVIKLLNEAKARDATFPWPISPKSLGEAGAHSVEESIYSKFSEINEYIAKHKDIVDPDGTTVLEEAAKIKDFRSSQLLLEAGADPNVVDRYGSTLLMSAAFSKNHALVLSLLNAGANIDSVDRYGKSPLMYALLGGSIEIVSLFIERVVDLDIADNSGKYPLMYAIQSRSIEIASLLIEQGVYLNVADDHGWTPLVYARIYDLKDLVPKLITAGAKVAVVNKQGNNALSDASSLEIDLAQFYIGAKATDIAIDAVRFVNRPEKESGYKLIYDLSVMNFLWTGEGSPISLLLSAPHIASKVSNGQYLEVVVDACLSVGLMALGGVVKTIPIVGELYPVVQNLIITYHVAKNAESLYYEITDPDNSLKSAQAYQDLKDYFSEKLDSDQEMLWVDDKKILGHYNYGCDPRFDLDCYWS